MASMILSTVGSAWGPVGQLVGAVVGSVIDSLLFSPHTEGPRLTDLKVTSSAYGIAIPLVYGPENRLAGNIIWTTGLIEKEEEQSAKGGPTVTTYSYSTSLAILVAQGRCGALKRVWANSKLIYDSSENPTGKLYSSLTWYYGTDSQNPDPVMEAVEGAGNVPGYRGYAYCVIKSIQLADFGNSVPNFEFEIEGYAPDGTVIDDVAGWIKDIAGRCGLEGLDIATAAISQPGKGYAIGRETNGFAAIEPLSLAYNFDLAEQQGQIRCVSRGQLIHATVPIDEMGASDQATRNESADPFRVEINPKLDMPREVLVNFSDPDLDYQQNSQRARRQVGNPMNNLTRDLAVVLSTDQAAQTAEMALRDAWAARRTAKFNVTDRWRGLQAAMVFGAVVGDYVKPFKVMKATRGHSGIIEIEARMADPEAYLSTASGVAGRLPANPLSQPGETRFIAIDSIILRDVDDDSGFYWACGRIEKGWRGAVIYRSTDGGADYAEMSRIGITAKIADLVGTLPDGPTEYFDEGNTIVVQMYDERQQLESLSEAAVLAGGNTAWIGNPATGQGGEIIQFRDAVLVGYGQYELSGLLRGRHGTEFATGSHGAGEALVLLNAGAMGRSDFGAGDWDRERNFKPVSVLTALADTTDQTFTNSGEGKRPLSPVHVAASRDGSDNVTLTWIRRTRLSVPGLGYGPIPLGEETESYEIDILDGATVVRTITANSETASYSAADQTADGLTPGDAIDLIVYQMSASRGRGHGRSATV